MNKENSFLLSLTSQDSQKLFKPNIYNLLVIGCTLPVNSAEAERSFSLLRRIKTYLRSTMTEERMSDLAVIAMNYNIRIPVADVCKAFVQTHPRRFQPSLFME